jgi:hypothetical protein
MNSPALAAVLLLLASLSQAQTEQENPAVTSNRLTQRNWSQIRPNFGYLNGCTTGYRSFYFDQDGYFVFNRNVHGTWRLTPQGSLILRTKSGQTLSLELEGSTLTYTRRNTATAAEREAATPPPATTPDSSDINPSNVRPPAPGLPPLASPGTTQSVTPPPVSGVPVNPPYNSVASGALRFRTGDQFQECD